MPISHSGSSEAPCSSSNPNDVLSHRTVACTAETAISGEGKWQQILAEYPAILPPFAVLFFPAHGVQHCIETTGRLSQQNFAAYTRSGLQQLSMNLLRCSPPASSTALHPVVPAPCTWCKRRMGRGGPVGISGG
jgi:hypothetical protein